MNENGTWCSICLAPTNIFFHASLHFRVHPIFIKINVCIKSITAWCYQCISESKMLFCCHKIFITTFNCLKIVQFNVSKWICYILKLVIAPQVERVEVKVKIRMDFLLTCHYMAESQTNIHNRIIIIIDIQHSLRHCTPKRMCLNVHETFLPQSHFQYNCHQNGSGNQNPRRHSSGFPQSTGDILYRKTKTREGITLVFCYTTVAKSL